MNTKLCVGFISNKRKTILECKLKELQEGFSLVRKNNISPNKLEKNGIIINHDGKKRSAFDLLSFKNISFSDLNNIWPETKHIKDDIREQIEIESQYSGYLERQREDIIDFKKYNSYLEIGCDRNQSFSNIKIEKRIGVDPVEGGTHKMTSDHFFSINKDNFDIIFIDGLHEYTQVMKDIKNSLKVLNKEGIILLHDCLPRTIWNQITPRLNSDWNGDVWKSIVHCRTLENIDTYPFIDISLWRSIY